jgi:mono/diheme cytochrome c family protein
MVPFLFLQVGCVDRQSDLSAEVVKPYLPDPERIVSVPVYGGTMESAPGIRGVVAADPEGDRLLRVVGKEVLEIGLGYNARPFRVHVEETRAWVTLRGRGELTSVSLDTGEIEWTTRVCLEPRGVTRSQAGPLLVACAGGEIVEVDDDGALLRLAILDVDLRDVVAANGVLLVSRFTTGEILEVDPDTLLEVDRVDLDGVVWRMRPYDFFASQDDPWPEPGALVLRQIMNCETIELPGDDTDTATEEESPAYGSTDSNLSCHTPLVKSQLMFVGRYGPRYSQGLEGATAATDMVITQQGEVAVANAGAGKNDGDVLLFQYYAGSSQSPSEVIRLTSPGRASALAVDEDGSLVAQAAGPLSLQRLTDMDVVLEEPKDETDEAIRLFQEQPGVGVSCASCHPEGLDDGKVWMFLQDDQLLLRRTMPLAGRILSRQPYHWDGALEDAHALMDDTFVRRMGGSVGPDQTAGLFEWLDALRHVRAHPAAPESDIEIGREAFETAGCGVCHGGPAFTNNQLAYTGDMMTAFKVPSLLGVGVRNRLQHDGCAYDLNARFAGDCEEPPDTHGALSRLTEHEIEALKAYLRTL